MRGNSSPLRVGGRRWAVSPAAAAADAFRMMLQTTAHAPALGRASGTAPALWHAVELHRPVAELDGACELSVCGALARVVPEDVWPHAGADVCPACAVLAR